MVLIEEINSTHHALPHAESHEKLFFFIKTADCAFVQYLDQRKQCEFILQNKNCRDAFYLDKYMKFVYCIVGTTTLGYIFGLFLLTLLLCLLSLLAADIIDRFFCPALAAISNVLHMGEALSGVTLLAFGNGLSDLFSSWVDMYGDTTGVYASNFGCCVFITSIIAPFVIFTVPFRPYPPYFVRDSVFLLFAVIFINYIMMDGTVNIMESTTIILIYLIYVFTVILDQAIIVKLSQDIKKQLTHPKTTDTSDVLIALLREVNAEKSFTVLDHESGSVLDKEVTRSAKFVATSPNTRLFRQFLHSLYPIRRAEWESSTLKSKVYQLIKAPVIFILLVFIPVMDYNQQIHGWSKLLNSIQTIATPMLVLVSLHVFTATIYYCCLAFGIPLFIVIFMTSRTDEPPKYHPIFAVISLLACALVIDHLTQHITSVLTALGIALQTTDTFLAVTISSWAGSMLDLVTNVTLARQGHYRMGFAACFGGPIFNITIGFGVNFISKVLKSSERIAHVKKGTVGGNIYLTQILILVFFLFGVSLAKFQARKCFAISLFCIYGLFLLKVIAIEFELIHGYGTDHHEQRIAFD